jgi:hypothetical protein
MVTINDLAQLIMDIAGKQLSIKIYQVHWEFVEETLTII